jgi:hypothetical protein
MDWQPIDTVPKDGTNVLLFADGEVTYGRWRGEVRGEDQEWAEEWVVPPGWWIMNTFLPEKAPTHWIPLPAPPKENS